MKKPKKTHFLRLTKVGAYMWFSKYIENLTKNPYPKVFRRALLSKTNIKLYLPASVSTDHIVLPSIVGLDPWDPTALIDIGAAPTTDN